MGKIPAKHDPFITNVLAMASFVVGADAGTTVPVAIQLKDARGVDLAQRAFVQYYLSDDANGDSVLATPVTSVAIGTDGVHRALTTGQNGWLTSEADGDIDIVVTVTGAKTLYLVLIMPDGSLSVSPAIVFT